MKSIIICGSGPSLHNFTLPPNYDIMVLNDSEKFISSQPDYLLCVNEPDTFSPRERYDTIFRTSAKCVLSHLSLPLQDPILLNKFILGEKSSCRLDAPECDFSSSSDYMGVILSYKMGYTKIYLIGVDFINHKFLTKRQESINSDYLVLYNKLKDKEIELWNLSNCSLLTSVPRYNQKDLV